MAVAASRGDPMVGIAREGEGGASVAEGGEGEEEEGEARAHEVEVQADGSRKGNEMTFTISSHAVLSCGVEFQQLTQRSFIARQAILMWKHCF